MPESHCLNHQGRPAVVHCHRCHKPLCEECVLATAEGEFCGETCRSQYVTFHAKGPIEPRGPGWIHKLLRFAVLVAALFGILYVLARWGELKWARGVLEWFGIHP